MTTFISLATLMIIVATALLAVPLLRTPRIAADTADRNATNLSIFRDQLAELEHERSEGSLTAADFEQARTELQRRLLEDVKPESTNSKEAAPSRKTALIIMILLPLVGLGGYGLLGNPRALDPANTRPPERVTAAQVEGMVEKLAQKLKDNPGDTQGWVMLARSYKTLGRFAEAAEAYSHATEAIDKNPALLTDYADLLAQLNDGSMRGKPGELVKRALKLDPNDAQALMLAGVAAAELRDFNGAIAYWTRLLPMLEPGSEDATMVEDAIARVRSASETQGKGSGKAASGPRISGEVTVSPKLAAQLRPNDVLFVFARADSGPGMPLAVIRQSAGNLPLKFSLDDSMALPGGEKLSAHKSVTVEARIAKSGDAKTTSGDLFGRQTGIKPGKEGVKLVIDQIVP
jgi:cytochrome c-type biogenesis protein CcmH